MERMDMTEFAGLVKDRSQGAHTLAARGAPPSNANPFGAAPAQAAPARSHEPAGSPQTAQPADGSAAPQRPAQPAPAAQRQGGEQHRGFQRRANRYEEERQLRRARNDALNAKLKEVDVSHVMGLLGAEPNQDGDSAKWKLHGFGNINVHGQKWATLQMKGGGYGPVGLVMLAKSLSFPQAIEWLAKELGESVDSDEIKAAAEKDQGPKIFTPPMRVEKNIHYVRQYLHYTRRIPMPLINQLIEQGSIYADEYKNCVFTAPGIAELRATHDGEKATKRLAEGSTRGKGFIVLPDPAKDERVLAVCESAIDSLSYRSLFPGRIAISSAGVNQDFAFKVAEDATTVGLKVVAAFDADKAGDVCSQALFNYFYLKLWIKHKGQAELGREFDDDEIYETLASNKVMCRLPIVSAAIKGMELTPEMVKANELLERNNVLFFNSQNPFADPARPPVILVDIKQNNLGLPLCQDFALPVSRRGYEFIVEKLGVTRHRPSGEKDWNEILKKAVADASLGAPSQTPASTVAP